ncbi:MAG: endolytic transglycosylase MltG [Eggerthellaceae bacterium]|nr:endolytic transglycosylase MltG [Eggerthellaceae bacterium]
MSPRKQVTYSQNPNRAARAAHAKGEKQFRTYDTSYIRPKRSLIVTVLGILLLIAAIAAIVFGVFSFLKGCTASNLLPEGEQVEIVVVEGEGPKSIAKTLIDAGMIENSSSFTERVNELGAQDSLQPGTYTLTGGQSIDEIIAILSTPVAAPTFTVPEGSTLAQTAAIVAEASEGRISADDFVNAASDASKFASEYSFLADAGTASLEGFLFPKTYPINVDSTAESIIRDMLKQFASETATLDWSYAENLGYSHYDVVKLASIIEKESDADHRATVASVFYNRLENGWQLQSDATVAYTVGHDPTPEDVQTETDYNTYFIYGLPPTPINSPSLECLKAACNPEKTNYFYFYFEPDDKGDMKYTFSETYEEHQAAYE